MRRPAKVFAVSADTAYEGGTAIAVFDTQELGDAFAARCRDYDRRFPEAPREIADTPENDAVWNAWNAAVERWRAKHPGKQTHTNDSYSVYPIPYFKK